MSPQMRRLASHLCVRAAAVSTCALLFTAAPAQAVEQAGGLDSFLRQMLGGATQTEAAAPQAGATSGWFSSAQRRRSYIRQRARLQANKNTRVKYASLPAPEEAKDSKPKGPRDIVPLQERAYLANPAEALLRDPTLRKGDIVVLREGPKVFTGAAQAVHRVSDFEDAHRSKVLSIDLRKRLAAMTAPTGALPADEARKRVSSLETRRVEPQALSLRVTAKLGANVAPLSPRVIYP